LHTPGDFYTILDNLSLAFATSVTLAEMEVARNLAQAKSEEFKVDVFLESQEWPETLKESFRRVQKGDLFDTAQSTMVDTDRVRSL